MNNQALSKIWILIILIVFITGGILVWQYFTIQKEKLVKDGTVNWKVYRNEKFGFQIKYPPFLKTVSTGPNLEQQKLERGEIISGTVAASYDTIIFSNEENKKQFSIGIFHPKEENLSEDNYQGANFYLFGSCDLRWEFEPIVVQMIKSNDIKVLEVKGEQTGPGREVPAFLGCYYFKNRNKNMIVLSTADFDNKSDFEEMDSLLQKILSTITLSQVGETANWKTYRNEKYRFEFKYPSTWSLEELTGNRLKIIHPNEPLIVTDFNVISWYKNYQDIEKITGFRYNNQSKKWGYIFYQDYYDPSGPGEFRELDRLYLTEEGISIYCLSHEGGANHLIPLSNNNFILMENIRCIMDSSYPSPEDKLYKILQSFRSTL